MIRKTERKPLPLIVLSISFTAVMLINIFALRVSTIVLMLAAAFAGLAVYFIKRRSGKEAPK